VVAELIPVVLVLGAFSVYATWRTLKITFMILVLRFAVLLAVNQTEMVAVVTGNSDSLGALGFFAPRVITTAKLTIALSFLIRRDAPWASRTRIVTAARPGFRSSSKTCIATFFMPPFIFLGILWYDAITAFWFDSPTGKHFGIGIGSLVLLANIVLLSGYTLSCHFAEAYHRRQRRLLLVRSRRWTQTQRLARVSFLNERHMLFAWLSLFSVGLADLYVRLVGLWFNQ